jgi:transcriptional regulator with XRE-family HTH domain
MHVGDVVHKLRKSKKMTLLELSNASGVAIATLSRIENGKMTGTLESHMGICRALEINLPELYRDLSSSKKTVEMRQKTAKADVFIHDNKAASEMLATNFMNKKMMPVLIKIGKSGRTHSEETKSGVEKFIYILEGKVEASVGNTKYDLSKGDTLYFESSLPHHFRNSGTGEARVISVTTPPAL